MRAGSFALLGPAILVASVSVTAEQRPLPPPVIAPMPPAPPRPAPAALSVPNPLAGLQPGPRDLYQAPDGSDRFQHQGHYPVPPVVGGPLYPATLYPFPYFYSAPYYETSMAETYRSVMAGTYLRQHREEVAHGGLVLQSVPGIAQVYVDGYYFGTAEEFGPGGRPIDLSAGPHRIELRSPGYDTLAFSVMIEPRGLVRYRGDMQVSPKPAAAAAPSQPAAAKNVYIIPNCYAGDKAPTTALPKGCDLKNLRTRK
jgi:hypothetical protein